MKEVFASCVAAIPLALLVAWIHHRKLLNKLGRLIRVTNKYGDESLFSYVLNSPDVTWVWVRDFENNLSYEGLCTGFSETNEVREVLLQDVTVHRNEDSKLLYRLPALYLSFERGKMAIELCTYSGGRKDAQQSEGPQAPEGGGDTRPGEVDQEPA